MEFCSDLQTYSLQQEYLSETRFLSSESELLHLGSVSLSVCPSVRLSVKKCQKMSKTVKNVSKHVKKVSKPVKKVSKPVKTCQQRCSVFCNDCFTM